MSQRSQAIDISDNCHFPFATMCETDERTNLRKLLNATPSVSGDINGTQTPIDSDKSSDSSDESYNATARSRPMIRSASPRRSASPMRRVQIGRSGSRRSTALTIKSLGFYPVRERILAMNRENESSSGDEDPKEVPKKPESSVRHMSVQDAINLFESKQRDLNLEFQKRQASAETGASFINTKKSVLRRWSARTEDNSAECVQDNTSSDVSQKVAENSLPKKSVEEKTMGGPPTGSETIFCPGNVKIDNATDEDEQNPAKNGNIGLLAPEMNENCDLELASSEWNLQMNAELNQLVVKMIENKPSGDQNQGGNSANKILDVSSAQKGGFYEQYKEKRDAKLRGENAGKRAEKDAKFKAMQEDLDRKKAEIFKKSGHANAKQDQLEQSQITLRSSSPSGNPKRENSKPVISRKAPIRSSPVSSMHTSSPRTSTTPTKTSTTLTPTSTSSASIRKKQQPVPSPTRANPRIERSQVQHSKNANIKVRTEGKPTVKSKDDKKHNLISRSRNNCGVKSRLPSATDDSAMTSAKPSFYNKVTKKSSVVPLESKPFLRKGTGIGPGVGPNIVKAKVAQLADSSKADVNLAQAQESEADTENVDASQLLEINEDQVKMDVAGSGDCNNFLNKFGDVIKPDNKKNDVTDQSYSEADDTLETEATFTAEAPLGIEQMNAQEDVTDLIWAQMDQQEEQLMRESASSEATVPTIVTPEPSIRSPRVHHSLSQMLQADNGEAEITNEWGNAENPPALVYQKDSPKGFRRLLKFTRKNRGGDCIATGLSSSPVFSEGEDDNDEPKGFTKKNIDALLRKSAPHVKGFRQQKTMLGESYDGGNSSKRSLEYNALHEHISKHVTQSSSPKFGEDHVSSAAAASSKASRSFFSLSTFRSKGNEGKTR